MAHWLNAMVSSHSSYGTLRLRRRRHDALSMIDARDVDVAGHQRHKRALVLCCLLGIPTASSLLIPHQSSLQNRLRRSPSGWQTSLHAEEQDDVVTSDAKSRVSSQHFPDSTQNYLSSTTPYNLDIARTLFPPLFFNLYQYKKKQHQQTQAKECSNNPSVRHLPQRPSPFLDPSSAQTAERMLRRMMENRYRSDGRTACPDYRTFNLVAGAFGRMRCGTSRPQRQQRKQRGGKRSKEKTVVSWKEEPKHNPKFRSGDSHNYNQIVATTDQAEGRNANTPVTMTPVDKLQELLQLQLQLCHYEGWSLGLRPSVSTYNRILKRLAFRSGNFSRGGDAIQALEWLQLMKSPLPATYLDDISREDMMCCPNAMSYAYVIEALSSYDAATASVTKQLSTIINPTLQSVETLSMELDVDMEVFAVPNGNSLEWFIREAEKLLVVLEEQYHQMLENSNDGSENRSELITALAHSYKCILKGWGRYSVTGDGTKYSSVQDDFDDATPSQKREYAITRANELLCRLEELSNEKQSATQVNFPSGVYSSVVLALSVSRRSTAAFLSEEVMQRMLARYELNDLSNAESFVSPSGLHAEDVVTALSGCIAVYAKNKDAPRAESVLNKMIGLYNDGRLGDSFVPDVRAYCTVMTAWSKYDATNAQNDGGKSSSHSVLTGRKQRVYNADRVEYILTRLEDLAESEASKGNNDFVLDATPYNIAIHSRVQAINRLDKPSYSDKAVFYEDEKANERTLLHAMTLLDHMEYDKGIPPDSYTLSILLHAWAQQSRPGNEKAADQGKFLPFFLRTQLIKTSNAVLFLLLSLAAEGLLRRRIQSDDVKKSLDNSNMRTKREKSKDVWPNSKHYSSVLKAHAKTKSAAGAKKALSLLSEMERRYSNADIILYDDGSNCKEKDTNVSGYHIEERDAAKADLVCYSIVIDCFANSRLPEASAVAYRLLQSLEAKYNGGDTSMKPNTRIYTAVILSLVHSPYIGNIEGIDDGGEPSQSSMAWYILEKMKENGVAPNSFTYNYIINCAAQCNSGDVKARRLSFEIAIRAFQELRKTGDAGSDHNDACQPDSFTFAFVLKACNNLLPIGSPLRTKVLTHTFQECCRAGYLNDAVLDRLWNGVSSSEEFYSLVGCDTSEGNKISVQDLPLEWRRNSANGKRKATRVNDKETWEKGKSLATFK